MSSPPTIAVVGAGAAGLMAAIHATGGGARVILLERTADGGRKILISGGGRCNVLPSVVEPSQYRTTSSPHLLRRMLRAWPLAEQRRFFEEELDLALALEPETGKLFPVAGRARAVRDALVRRARVGGVEWRPGSRVLDLEPAAGRWRLHLEGRSPLSADRVILATGGLSVPQTGSDGLAYPILARLGHQIRPTYPALTPLTLTPPRFADLAGVSLPVTLRSDWEGKRESRGGFLFTHRGYSGPAVLDLSDVAVRSRLTDGPPAALRVAWGQLTTADWEARLSPSAGSVIGALRGALPARLADLLAAEAGVAPDTVLAQLPRRERLRLLDVLTRWPLPWSGDEGYRKAEVTGGGVALEEVDPATMASRIVPGLHLAGELLDAFGPIGGYNFLWAWATGRQAGLGARRPLATPGMPS